MELLKNNGQRGRSRQGSEAVKRKVMTTTPELAAMLCGARGDM